METFRFCKCCELISCLFAMKRKFEGLLAKALATCMRNSLFISGFLWAISITVAVAVVVVTLSTQSVCGHNGGCSIAGNESSMGSGIFQVTSVKKVPVLSLFGLSMGDLLLCRMKISAISISKLELRNTVKFTTMSQHNTLITLPCFKGLTPFPQPRLTPVNTSTVYNTMILSSEAI